MRLDKKFLGDSAWNYGAFALMAATGVALNVFIVTVFGVEPLGIFNQVYAVYVVSSQLAVFGIHNSSQKHIAEYAGSPDQRRSIVLSAVWVSLIFGLIMSLILFTSSSYIGNLTSSTQVANGVALAATGLLLFPLNKVLLGVLNGERRMKAFAIVQSARVLSILAFAGAVALADWPAYALGGAFPVAEFVIVFPLLFVVRPWSGPSVSSIREWAYRHIQFGSRAIANGFLAESYIRVDVMMLGIFASDETVGIYSFAAMFIEGLYQVPVVIRTVANPVLVRLISDESREELVRFTRKTMFGSFATFSVMAGLVILVFPYLAPYFPEGLVSSSFPVLVVVVMGLALYALFIPVDFSLMQAGMPGRQSLMMCANILINVTLNASLIPVMGVMGAAWATAVAFVSSALVLNIAAHKWLGVTGGFLLYGVGRK